nr:MAG TPA: hypothetical protein [Caudoviricetes sp.]
MFASPFCNKPLVSLALFAIIVLLIGELYDTFCHMSIKLNLNMTKKGVK